MNPLNAEDLRLNPDRKDISGCAIAGVMSETGERFGGGTVVQMIANMHERSNGLGGGFAAYGIYPDNREHYALHVMYESPASKAAAEAFLSTHCRVHQDEPIPTRVHGAIPRPPILHRYFVSVRPEALREKGGRGEEDTVIDLVMHINCRVDGACVFSSGRNMGVFKGVGYPEDIGEFYRLEEYRGYIWTSHGRFPTNTTGWWGGAHPFGLLDWTVVHNGEVSSYGINSRYLANFGYRCALHTDTEVIAYLFDLLARRHALPLEAVCAALAPPFWSQIARLPEGLREAVRAIRITYGGALLNGPFSILVGHARGMIGFNDRTKLRPMVYLRSGDRVYVASEEAAIREVCASGDRVSYAEGGVPVVAALREGVGEPAPAGREAFLCFAPLADQAAG